MNPEFKVPPDQFRDFMDDLQGCVIGRKLADKFGWKIGDHFFLESFIPGIRKKSGPFEFVVRGIFDTDPGSTPAPTRTSCSSTSSTCSESHGPADCRPAALHGGDRRPATRRRDRGRDRRALRELRRRRPTPRPRAPSRPASSPWSATSALLAERDRPRGVLHHPAGHRQHHEHGGARAAHGDRGAQDARLRAAAR